MREVVLDASVVVKWFVAEREHGTKHAHALRNLFESGALTVIVPALLELELVNVAGRRWGWETDALLELVTSLRALGFEFKTPDLGNIARWTGLGLTAYDATYVALAQEEAVPLVTDDELILRLAREIAVPLSMAA